MRKFSFFITFVIFVQIVYSFLFNKKEIIDNPEEALEGDSLNLYDVLIIGIFIVIPLSFLLFL
jgi:hypothetical protein